MPNNMLRFNEQVESHWKSDAEKELEMYGEIMYPVDCLPDFMKKLLKEGADNLQAEPQIVAQAIIMATFASLQGKLSVIAPDGRGEKVVGYMVAVAPSASGKSRSSRKYIEPFRKFEQCLKEKYKADYRGYLSDISLWKLKLKKLDKKYEKCSDPDECINLEMQRRELYENMPNQVSSVNLIFDRATPAALVSAASKSNLSMFYVNDEGYGFYLGAMGKQHDIVNGINDGADYSQVSLERGTESCKGATLNISLYIQNPQFASVRDKMGDRLKSSGADSRCLYSYTNIVGSSDKAEQSSLNWCYFEEYERRIEKITSRFNCCNNEIITLSDDAKNKYIEFYDQCVHEIHQSKIADHMPEYMIRSAGHLLKVASVLAIIEDPSAEIISGSIMESAESIVNYHTMVYDRILKSELYYNRKGLEEDANDLFDKIKMWRDSGKNVNRTKLMQFGPAKLRSKNRLNIVINILLAQQKIDIAINKCIYVRYH